MNYDPDRRFKFIMEMVNDILSEKYTRDWFGDITYFRFRSDNFNDSPSLFWFLNIIIYGLFRKEFWITNNDLVRKREEGAEYSETFWKEINEKKDEDTSITCCKKPNNEEKINESYAKRRDVKVC